jgi:hypothetical protein
MCAKGVNRGASCTRETRGGQVFNAQTGKSLACEEKYVTQAVHLGYSLDAQYKSIREVTRFLRETFCLKY